MKQGAPAPEGAGTVRPGHDSDQAAAAVDIDRLARDVACFLGREERHYVGDVGWIAGPAHREVRFGGLDPVLDRATGTFGRPLVMSVTTKPGANALAVMPNGPSSMAAVRTKPCRPIFAVA
jgi:hypothetical protein